MNNLPTKQRGLGWFGNLLILIIVAGFFLTALRIGPYYYEYYKIRSSAEALKKRDDLAQMSPERIRLALDQQLYMDQVDERLKPEQIKIRRTATQILIEIKYEIRDHLVANIDFVLNFAHSVLIKVS